MQVPIVIPRASARRAPSFAHGLAATLALVLGLSGCGKKAPPPPPPPLVVVAHPVQQEVIDWDEFVGRFEAVDSVDVRPRVSGYLDSIPFKDGDIVHRGQVIFQIDPRPYRAALEQAKGVLEHDVAALEDANIELKRAQGLFAAHAVSGQEVDNRTATQRIAQADVNSATAALHQAQLNLGWTKVTAPITGRISDRRFAPGSLVTADVTILTNIVDLNPIRFEFEGPESIYLKYERENLAGTRPSSRRLANPVLIRLQDETTFHWQGRMDFVDNQLDTQSGTIRGRAVLPNPTYFLSPGLFGHLRLLGSQRYRALLIPDSAVTTDQTRQVVLVVDAHGKTFQRIVTGGSLLGNLRVVRTGLKPEDTVIVEGLSRVRPGITVRTRMVQIPPAIQSPTAAAAVIEPQASVALPASVR